MADIPQDIDCRTRWDSKHEAHWWSQLLDWHQLLIAHWANTSQLPVILYHNSVAVQLRQTKISLDKSWTHQSCYTSWSTHTHTHPHPHPHTHTFNGPLSGTTRVSRYQKGKTNLDFTEARDSEWQWHPLVQVCTSLQSDNCASTQPLSFLQAGCPSCHPTNSVKALKAQVDPALQNNWKHDRTAFSTFQRLVECRRPATAVLSNCSIAKLADTKTSDMCNEH